MILTSYPLADMLLLGIVAAIVLHSVYLARKGRWLLFDPLNTFWAAAVFVYVFQPIKNHAAYASWRQSGTFEATLVYVLVSLVSVIAGYEAQVGVRLASAWRRVPARINPGRMQAAGIVLVLLAGLSYYLQFQSAGGAERWLAVPRGGTDFVRLPAYVSLLGQFLPLGVFLLVLQINLHPVGRWKVCAVWFMGGLLWLWFFYLGSRSLTVGVALFLVAAYYLPRRQNPSPVLIVPLVLGLFVLTTFQANYRGYFTDLSFHLDEIDMDEARESSVPAFWGEGSERKSPAANRGNEFHCVMAVVELVPGQIPYSYGYPFLHLVTLPIPRAAWPEKIYPLYDSYRDIYMLGDLGAGDMGVNNVIAGPTFTFIGFWLSVGGGVGLAIGSFLMGVFLRILRAVYDLGGRSEGGVVWIALMFTTGYGLCEGEPVLNIIHFFPMYVFPCLVFFWFAGEQANPFRAAVGNPGPGSRRHSESALPAHRWVHCG